MDNVKADLLYMKNEGFVNMLDRKGVIDILEELDRTSTSDYLRSLSRDEYFEVLNHLFD